MENELVLVNEEETTEMTNEEGRSGVGLGIAIGSLLTLGGIAAVNKVKKVVANHKAKKEAEPIEAEYVEVVTEDEVTEEPPVEEEKPKTEKKTTKK